MSAEDIQKHRFTSENQPPGERKSRKGIPNRATLLTKWLKTRIEIDDPKAEGEKIKVSMHDAIVLGQISAAAEGSTAAFKEIQDTIFGPIAAKTEITGKDGKDLNPQQFIVEIVTNDSTSPTDQDQEQ